MAQQNAVGMVDAAVFESLQAKIDDDIAIRDQIRDIVQTLEKQNRSIQSVLAKAQSVPSSQINGVVTDAAQFIHDPIDTIGKLAAVASKYPYYKYNGMWTKEVQKTCELILFTGWLGGRFPAVAEHDQGKLFTIDDLGEILQIPVNLKDRDAFHLTIEEYLHALISLIDELARLAVNSVTLGDFNKPPQISQFVKDIHAGFQILNLKNDSLRRRSDSIKYNVKKIEDVVYDLSLRNLIPRKT